MATSEITQDSVELEQDTIDALEASPHFKKSAGANHALVANKWMPVTGGSKRFGVGAYLRYPDTP